MMSNRSQETRETLPLINMSTVDNQQVSYKIVRHKEHYKQKVINRPGAQWRVLNGTAELYHDVRLNKHVTELQ